MINPFIFAILLEAMFSIISKRYAATHRLAYISCILSFLGALMAVLMNTACSSHTKYSSIQYTQLKLYCMLYLGTKKMSKYGLS